MAASRLRRWCSDLNREVAATRPGIAQGPVLSIGDRYAVGAIELLFKEVFTKSKGGRDGDPRDDY